MEKIYIKKVPNMLGFSVTQHNRSRAIVAAKNHVAKWASKNVKKFPRRCWRVTAGLLVVRQIEPWYHREDPSGCRPVKNQTKPLFCQQASSHTGANLRCPHSNFHSQRSSIVFSSSLSISTTKLSSSPSSTSSPSSLPPHIFLALTRCPPEFSSVQSMRVIK